MPTFSPLDPNFEQRVRASFARQQAMTTLGVVITHLAPGELTLEMPFQAQLTQQHGFLHAGIVTAVVDSACGYAALSLMPPEAAVLSVEYKVNLLAPAAGLRLRAVGRVLKPGRTLTICQGDAYMLTPEGEKHVALMVATMIARVGAGIMD